jgi:hypothetical protein
VIQMMVSFPSFFLTIHRLSRVRFARFELRRSAGIEITSGFSGTVILFIETGTLYVATQVGFTLAFVLCSQRWWFNHSLLVSSSIASVAPAFIYFSTWKCLWL